MPAVAEAVDSHSSATDQLAEHVTAWEAMHVKLRVVIQLAASRQSHATETTRTHALELATEASDAACQGLQPVVDLLQY